MQTSIFYPRLSKILIASVIAIFFTITIINNITDYFKTFTFIQHTLSMDTTAHNPAFMWRNINNPVLMHVAYLFIIFIQIVITILSLKSILSMFKYLNIHDNDKRFDKAVEQAFFAAVLGFVLYSIVFISIAGQWFMMRESKVFNVQSSVHTFISMLGICMLGLRTCPERNWL